MEPIENNNLNNYPRKHPYTVPESYFDNLPMQIQQRVQAQPKVSIFLRPLFSPKFRLSAVLGMFLVLAASVWFVMQNQQPSREQFQPIAFSQLTNREILNYLESDEASIETGDIALLTNFSRDQINYSLPAYDARDLEQEIELSDIEDYYL